MQGADTEVLQENLVLELEALKEMRVHMGRCLEAMQLVRKDLQIIAENLEMLEAFNKDWCHSLEKEKRTENKDENVR